MAKRGSDGVSHHVTVIGETRAAYTAAGAEGMPVVLVHGGAGDRRDWTRSFPAIASSYRVFAPDLIGYGESSRPGGKYDIGLFSRFLTDFMDALGLERAALVGHSLGARACLEIAMRDPDRVAKLVLVSPVGFGGLSVSGYILGTAGWALSKAVRRALPYPPLDIQLKDPNPQGFRDVRCPTLVLWGRADMFFPSKYARRAVELIPDSRLKIFTPVRARAPQEPASGLQQRGTELPRRGRRPGRWRHMNR